MCISFLREDTDWMMTQLHRFSVPLLIFSAGVGDVIELTLQREGLMYNNVKIVSNFMDFNHQVSSVSHPFNKFLLGTQDQWLCSRLWYLPCVNPLHAIFFRENINIYLHFMSFLHTDYTQVVEIPPRVRQGPAYSTYSISWLLMSWRRKEPGHQQPWYWPS